MRIARMLGLTVLLAGALAHSAAGQELPGPRPCVILGEMMLDGHYTPMVWPGGTVPYRFDANVTPVRREYFRQAAAEIEAVSAVRFVEWSGEPDFLHVIHATGNASYVGRQGGMQEFYIWDWEYRYIIVHELMHALGFFHEHQRPDRDQHITVRPCNVFGVNCENGVPVSLGGVYNNNFAIVNTGVQLGPYDHDSLMHYSRCDFAKICYPYGMCNCPPGSETISASRPLGSTQLSAGDIAALNYLYPTAPTCYADCDRSGSLDAQDFACFLARFSAGDSWANCDGSASAPKLTVSDLNCFVQRFAAGCP
jgi:hypothetical protein